ncbi:MAG: hypothetical protein CSA50_06865 [Gammaproteobacteria bacterium]|nr:MAG: hypothetical protein CSA50_06865 [Gammaproteobacteria bacterium]
MFRSTSDQTPCPNSSHNCRITGFQAQLAASQDCTGKFQFTIRMRSVSPWLDIVIGSVVFNVLQSFYAACSLQTNYSLINADLLQFNYAANTGVICETARLIPCGTATENNHVNQIFTMTIHAQSVFEKLKVNKLPSLPNVLVEMLRVCQNDSASFQTISAIVSQDIAIGARAISLANSSFYCRGDKITSLERALSVLGVETIKTLIVTASVQQFFSSSSSTHNAFFKSLWHQSVTCAMLSRAFATLTGYERPEEAYLTGLLHNIGELVLGSNYPDDFLSLLEQLQIKQKSQIELENERFLTNHCDIGAGLAEQWQLSEFAADAIRYHHTALDAVLDAHHLVKIIYLASRFSEKGCLESLENLKAADKLFGLNTSLAQQIVEQIATETADIADSMGIELDDTDSTESAAQEKIKLAEQLRNLGLLQSSSNLLSNAENLPQLVRHITTAAEMLFGFKNSLVFWLNDKTNSLESIVDPVNANPVRLTIAMQSARSIVASAALNRHTLFAVDQRFAGKTLSVIDRQLLRITGGPGIACIPILVKDDLKGVFVMGTNAPQDTISGSDQLVTLFASQVGRHISTIKKNHIQTNEAKQELTDTINAKVREIMHEANNPLSIIRNYLQALANKLQNSVEVQNEIDIIQEEIERTGEILLRLKDFSNNLEQDKPVDINGEIRNLVQLYNSSMFSNRNITCRLFLDEQMKAQMSGRNAIRQVITNLLKNAAEALSAGGNIRIRTTSTVKLNSKDFIEIIVSDNGPGIPSHIMQNLFKPVISTKGKEHSGLGLSITQSLVNQMKGSISCRSSDKGTEFQILLPDSGHRQEK